MEPNNDLHEMLIYNVTQALQVQPTAKSNDSAVYILARIWGNIAYLYQVRNRGLYFCRAYGLERVDETILKSWDYICRDGIPKSYGQIFWGHGYGVLAPVHDPVNDTWAILPDGSMQGTCTLRAQTCGRRGMLNAYTYLDIATIATIFKTLHARFNRKTAAFCGMDCCKGAMIEHAWELAPYVDYLVASQECELADGWDYHVLAEALYENPAISGCALVTKIVQGYAQYYQTHAQAQTYTLSALDVQAACKSGAYLAAFAQAYIELTDSDKHVLQPAMRAARAACHGFCDAPMYVDVIDMSKQLSVALDIANNSQFASLCTALARSKDAAEKAVVAKTGGEKVVHAQGMSVYFPQVFFDASYNTAAFGHDTGWSSFVQGLLVAENKT